MSYKKAEKNIVQRQDVISRIETKTYSVDILALELGDQLLETVILSLNANGRENLLDISGRRGGVATDLEEEVSSNVTHLEKEHGLGSVLFTKSILMSREPKLKKHIL